MTTNILWLSVRRFREPVINTEMLTYSNEAATLLLSTFKELREREYEEEAIEKMNDIYRYATVLLAYPDKDGDYYEELNTWRKEVGEQIFHLVTAKQSIEDPSEEQYMDCYMIEVPRKPSRTLMEAFITESCVEGECKP